MNGESFKRNILRAVNLIGGFRKIVEKGDVIFESYEGSSLIVNAWSYAQICRAVKLGLGVGSQEEYEVVSE